MVYPSKTEHLQRCRGTVLVESALSIWTFLFVLLVGIDFIRILSYISTMNSAVTRASRDASISPVSGLEAVRAQVAQYAFSNVDLNEIALCPTSAPGCGLEADQSNWVRPPAPGEWFTVQLQRPMRTLIGGFEIPLSTFALVKHEPDVLAQPPL